MRNHLMLVLTAALAGCAGTIPTGGADYGRLVLHEPLTIPAHAATLRLQYGRSVARNAVQEHDPFCVFELDTVAPVEQTVRPGSFAITGIGRSIETIAGLPAFTVRRVSFDDDGGGPTHIYYKTVFRLRDEAQAVRALTCMSNQNAPGIAPFMRHLTLAEIRAALGAAFALEPRF